MLRKHSGSMRSMWKHYGLGKLYQRRISQNSESKSAMWQVIELVSVYSDLHFLIDYYKLTEFGLLLRDLTHLLIFAPSLLVPISSLCTTSFSDIDSYKIDRGPFFEVLYPPFHSATRSLSRVVVSQHQLSELSNCFSSIALQAVSCHEFLRSYTSD